MGGLKLLYNGECKACRLLANVSARVLGENATPIPLNDYRAARLLNSLGESPKLTFYLIEEHEEAAGLNIGDRAKLLRGMRARFKLLELIMCKLLRLKSV